MSLSIILDSLKSKDKHRRSAAAIAFRNYKKIFDNNLVLNTISSLLNSDNSYEVLGALSILDKNMAKNYENELIHLLSSNNKEIKLKSMILLMEIKSKKALPYFKSLINSDDKEISNLSKHIFKHLSKHI